MFRPLLNVTKSFTTTELRWRSHLLMAKPLGLFGSMIRFNTFEQSLVPSYKNSFLFFFSMVISIYFIWLVNCLAAPQCKYSSKNKLKFTGKQQPRLRADGVNGNVSVWFKCVPGSDKAWKKIRRTSREKSRQSKSKLCLKVCFGVERALMGTPLRCVPSLLPHLGQTWPRLASFTHITHGENLW